MPVLKNAAQSLMSDHQRSGKSNKAQEQKKSTRCVELDALRGIAAVLVVLFHYTTRYPVLFPSPDRPLISVPWGHYGVNLFFTISGFVIFMTISKTRRPMDFVVSRFARLYPSYWFAAALTFFLVAWKLPARRVLFSQFLANLTMFQGFLNFPHVDFVYWTLTVELSFYMIMLLLLMGNQLRRIEPIMATWLILYLGWYALPEATRLKLNFKGEWLVEDFVFLHKQLNLFIMGITFNLMKMQRANWRRYTLAGLCVATELVVRDLQGLVVASLIFIGFTLLVWERLAFLRWKPLIFLGVISYPLYLVHQNIGYIIMNQVKQLGGNVNLAILVAIAVMVMGATLISFFIEQPAMGWIRRRYGHKANRMP